MRILVVSDTHIPSAADVLPAVIAKEAEKSDICLHAGDFISTDIVNQLSAAVKLYGVSGNMDDLKVRNALPHKQVIAVEKVKIGLIHGSGAPAELTDYIRREFEAQFNDIDIFVFGHSHKPVNEKKGGKVYFNPGSPTDKMFAPYNSYGILEIKGKNIKGRIVKIG